MKQIFLSLIFILGIVLQIQADNILSASSASGHPNDTVLIQLSLSNTDNVVAFQTEIPLGTSLSYIPNSCVLSSRSNGHSISATVVNGVLKILSYSLPLASYTGNSGVLATFRLRLGNEPGNISLALNNSRLSNSSGVALGITTNNGTITLLSPKIRINNPQIDFGHYPIRSTYNNSISITNIGNEPLVVNSLSFSNPTFFSNNFSQTTVSAGNNISIPISFSPTIAGNVSATVTIHSNSISGNQNASLIANPYSVNELHIANIEGYSDSIVNIDLSINNMDTIVGFQTKFILPSALEFISGSFTLSNRSNNHICLSGISGDTLTLLVYSPNNSTILNNSGVIASLRLRLNGSSGGYYLQPLNTVISNRNGINVLSDAYSGTVSIRSPYISCSNNINMGLSSVTENAVYNYSINNYGNAPLVIDNIVFTQNGFSLQDSLPITINQYNNNRSINIIYNGVNEGNFSALMKIYSNDPTHRLIDVNVSGNRYEPNELAFSVDTVNYSQNPQIAVNMNNYSSITAVQFDFYYPKNYYNISSSDFVLSSTRCPSHSISTIALNDSVWRVLVFSMQNQNITGNNGKLLNINMHPKTTTRQGIYRVRASGVILSNSAGVNKLTGGNPSYNFNVLIPTYTVYTVLTLSNNNTMGTISGAGFYNYLSTATIIATPNLHCIFLHWNDNNTNRTRNIIVSQDTTFTAYFKRIDTTYIRAEICQGSSYNFYGQTLTTTNTYPHTVIVGQYQDSVYILNLTVNQPKTTNLTASICQGQTYTLNGFNVNTAGLHTLNLQTYKGCDSTVNLTLTVNQPKITNLAAEICQGQTYNLNGFNTNTAGLHTLYLQTYKGCDSTINLTLTVNQPKTTNLSASICQGQTYTLNGFNTSTAGLHTQKLQTTKGCDSTVNLTLTVNQPTITNLSAEICQGQTYTLNGFNTSTAGLHTLNLYTYKGCDSTVNLTLTVNQPAITNLTAEICQGGTYALNGFNTSTAGLHTQNLQTYKGCDSTVNLTLTINQPAITNLTAEICQGETYTLNGFNTSAAGLHTQNLQTYKGCDSTVNLTLTVNQPAITNLTAEICQGETYTLNGFNTSTAGLHTQNLQTYKGCDSIVNLTLIVNQNKTTNLFAVITQGDVYNQNGFNETNTGVYTHNLQTYKGCDSIVVLTLNVYPATTNNINAEICQGETYTLNGFNESTEGIYTRTLVGYNGIDSIVTLILIVNQPATTNLTAEICQGETYTQNGFNTNTAGLHTRNLQTTKGCDSTVNLTLTINQPKTTNLTAEICQGETYTQNGFNTNTAGLHTRNLQTTKGCDSIVNLTLTINQPKTTNLTAEICQGQTYSLNGFNVNTAGLHTQNLQTYKGCDSTVNLTLTVNQPKTTNLIAEICQGETYNLNGFNTSAEGLNTLNLQTYKGCDSTVNLTLTVNQPAITNLTAEICQGETYNLNGFNTSTVGLHTLNLQTYKGCDSTVNLTLIVNQPKTTNLTAEICQGQTYNLNGFNTNTAGLHTLNIQTYKGCDSTVNLILTVNQPTTTNLSAEICQGQTYNLNGFNVNTAGLHTHNLQTYKGCDSIVNLTLTINQNKTTNLYAVITQGDVYNQNGFNETNTGVYTHNLQTYKGCDSIVILTLNVYPALTTNITAGICQGQTYNLNGFNESTEGIYTQTLVGYNGIDSIVSLILIVNQPATSNLTADICQGQTYNLNGFNTSTAGLHTQNLQTYKGCDSTVNLTLTVNQPKTTNLLASICQGQTYNLNGYNVSTAGLHTLNLQNYKGCDSTVNLILTVNQPKTTNLSAEICQGETYTLNGFNTSIAGLHTQNLQTYKGCDSTVNLTLTVNQPAITNLTAEICQGTTYNLNGFNTSTAGLHTLNLQTYKGCDSTVNLTLTVNQPKTTNLTAEICQGETYNLNGFNVSTAGLHTQNLQTYKGCDSTVNLTLTVNQPATTNIQAEICQGETYTLNGFNVLTAGLHIQNLQTYKGCDSTVNLILTINQPAITNLTAEICQGETYTLNGFNVNTSGLHIQNLQTYKGCDSTVNLTLTVNQPAITNLTAEICQGETYTLNGFNTSTAGLHTLNLYTYKGCDSTINLTLSINQPAITNLTAEICQGETYTLNGFNTSTAGLHTLNLYTYKGCDSTVNLTLTVNQPAITNLIAEICQGQTYTLNGFNTSAAGLHTLSLQTYKGCDSIVTLNLTVNELITPTNLALDNIANYFEFSWQGNGESYVIYRNNDSIATITETIYHDTNVIVGTNYCYKIKALNSTCESELSGEICQIFSGLNDIKNNKISATLYPNPTDNKAILEIEGLTNQYDVIVYDLHGRTIKSYRLNLGEKKLEIDVKGFANGVYNIKIVNDKNSITKKLIVR